MPALMLTRRQALAAAAAAAALPVQADPAMTPVRGVWIAGPRHNAFWVSRAHMARELRQFRDIGLNTVYPVMWLQGRTLYPSARMQALTGWRQLDYFDERDAMQELLDEAGALGLRVVAWMEFGFASHHESHAERTLLDEQPRWRARNRFDRAVVKNGFHWLDGFHPEVQALLIDLCVELLQRYPTLAGVQGDDRLPAMPSSAGHSPWMHEAWRAAQAGRAVPQDDLDPLWLQWRADRLTDFLRRLRQAIKAVRPQAVLSLSPSPWPWGLQEYLQDAPAWLREGLVDELLPQLYRRDLPAYERLLAETLAWVPAAQRHRVFPGMLLALGSQTLPSAELLAQWLQATRAAGFQGECHFHSTGVLAHADVLQRFYRP